jgi:hypothetical protein
LSDVGVLEKLLFQDRQEPHIPAVPQPMEIRDAVLFKSRHPHATELRDLTERRVRFVLRRS